MYYLKTNALVCLLDCLLLYSFLCVSLLLCFCPQQLLFSSVGTFLGLGDSTCKIIQCLAYGHNTVLPRGDPSISSRRLGSSRMALSTASRTALCVHVPGTIPSVIGSGWVGLGLSVESRTDSQAHTYSLT